MAYNKANVLIGAATLYVDDALVGWTSGGVSIEHAADFYDVEVDQQPNPVKSFRVKETWKVKTNMSEATIENLKIAWGLDQSIDTTTYAGYKYLPFGGSTLELSEHTLDVYGNAPGDPPRQRRVHFYKAVAVEFGPVSIEKNKEQLIPVTFNCLVDTSQAANQQVGYIKDQTTRESKNLTCRVTVA